MTVVLYSSSDRIGLISLNRPEARKAVNREMALGLEAALDRLEVDPDVWVGVRCAYDLGLVSRLIEPGAALDEAFHLAQQIASAAPLSVRASRRVVLSAAHEHDDALRRISKELLDELLASEDASEGLSALAEKRAPQWQGR